MTNHYRNALALNNVAISLVERQCPQQALEVLGAADELLQKKITDDNETSQRYIAAANRCLACCTMYAVQAALKSLKIVNDTDVVDSILQEDFPQDMMHEKVPLKCYLIRFTEADDITLAHVTVRFNVANLMLSYNFGNNQMVQHKAHTLFSLAFIPLDATVYGSSMSPWRELQFRSLLVLTLRCLVYSASNTQISDAYFSAMTEEFYEYQELDEAVLSKDDEKSSLKLIAPCGAPGPHPKSLAPAA